MKFKSAYMKVASQTQCTVVQQARSTSRNPPDQTRGEQTVGKNNSNQNEPEVNDKAQERTERPRNVCSYGDVRKVCFDFDSQAPEGIQAESNRPLASVAAQQDNSNTQTPMKTLSDGSIMQTTNQFARSSTVTFNLQGSQSCPGTSRDGGGSQSLRKSIRQNNFRVSFADQPELMRSSSDSSGDLQRSQGSRQNRQIIQRSPQASKSCLRHSEALFLSKAANVEMSPRPASASAGLTKTMTSLKGLTPFINTILVGKSAMLHSKVGGEEINLHRSGSSLGQGQRRKAGPIDVRVNTSVEDATANKTHSLSRTKSEPKLYQILSEENKLSKMAPSALASSEDNIKAQKDGAAMSFEKSSAGTDKPEASMNKPVDSINKHKASSEKTRASASNLCQGNTRAKANTVTHTRSVGNLTQFIRRSKYVTDTHNDDTHRTNTDIANTEADRHRKTNDRANVRADRPTPSVDKPMSRTVTPSSSADKPTRSADRVRRSRSRQRHSSKTTLQRKTHNRKPQEASGKPLATPQQKGSQTSNDGSFKSLTGRKNPKQKGKVKKSKVSGTCSKPRIHSSSRSPPASRSRVNSPFIKKRKPDLSMLPKSQVPSDHTEAFQRYKSLTRAPSAGDIAVIKQEGSSVDPQKAKVTSPSMSSLRSSHSYIRRVSEKRLNTARTNSPTRSVHRKSDDQTRFSVGRSETSDSKPVPNDSSMQAPNFGKGSSLEISGRVGYSTAPYVGPPKSAVPYTTITLPGYMLPYVAKRDGVADQRAKQLTVDIPTSHSSQQVSVFDVEEKRRKRAHGMPVKLRKGDTLTASPTKAQTSGRGNPKQPFRETSSDRSGFTKIAQQLQKSGRESAKPSPNVSPCIQGPRQLTKPAAARHRNMTSSDTPVTQMSILAEDPNQLQSTDAESVSENVSEGAKIRDVAYAAYVKTGERAKFPGDVLEIVHYQSDTEPNTPLGWEDGDENGDARNWTQRVPRYGSGMDDGNNAAPKRQLSDKPNKRQRRKLGMMRHSVVRKKHQSVPVLKAEREKGTRVKGSKLENWRRLLREFQAELDKTQHQVNTTNATLGSKKTQKELEAACHKASTLFTLMPKLLKDANDDLKKGTHDKKSKVSPPQTRGLNTVFKESSNATLVSYRGKFRLEPWVTERIGQMPQSRKRRKRKKSFRARILRRRFYPRRSVGSARELIGGQGVKGEGRPQDDVALVAVPLGTCRVPTSKKEKDQWAQIEGKAQPRNFGDDFALASSRGLRFLSSSELHTILHPEPPQSAKSAGQAIQTGSLRDLGKLYSVTAEKVNEELDCRTRKPRRRPRRRASSRARSSTPGRSERPRLQRKKRFASAPTKSNYVDALTQAERDQTVKSTTQLGSRVDTNLSPRVRRILLARRQNPVEPGKEDIATAQLKSCLVSARTTRTPEQGMVDRVARGVRFQVGRTLKASTDIQEEDEGLWTGHIKSDNRRSV